MNRNPYRPGSLVTAIDVGSDSITCAAAELDTSARFHVKAMAQRRSEGIRNGHVVHMSKAARVLGEVIDEVEQGTKKRLLDVIVSADSPTIRSYFLRKSMDLGHQPPTRTVIQSMVRNAVPPQAGQEILYRQAINYVMDGQLAVEDPNGMTGKTMDADIHLVTGERTWLRNVVGMVEKCDVRVRSIVPSGYASAMACIGAPLRGQGVLYVDMGAGTTTVSVFGRGKLLFLDCLPIGGAAITSDIAKIFNLSLTEGERIKTLYGQAIAGHRREAEQSIAVETLAGTPERIDGHLLIPVIQARLREIITLMHERLGKAGVRVPSHMVLAGGGMDMPGLPEIVQETFDICVWCAKIQEDSLQTSPSRNPCRMSCAGALGLLALAAQEGQDLMPWALPKGIMGYVAALLTRWPKAVAADYWG